METALKMHLVTDWAFELGPGRRLILKVHPISFFLLLPAGPFLPPSALLPDTDFFPGTVSLPGLEPPGGPDLLDDGFAYDPAAPTLFTMLDMLPQRHHSPALSRATGGQGPRSRSPRALSR